MKQINIYWCTMFLWFNSNKAYIVSFEWMSKSISNYFQILWMQSFVTVKLTCKSLYFNSSFSSFLSVVIRNRGGDWKSCPDKGDCFRFSKAAPHCATLPFCFPQSVSLPFIQCVLSPRISAVVTKHHTWAKNRSSCCAWMCLCSLSVSQYSDENMMQPYNLAVCFGPSLLRGLDADDAVAQQPQVNDLVKTMILHHDIIFPSRSELPGPVYEKHMTLEQEYWWGQF